jgi:oxygen-independent coproporphyrinogen-3 oxidase
MMGLRLAEGVDLAALAAKTGLAEATMVDADEVAKLADLGFVEQRGDGLVVQPSGMPLLDALLPKIIAL